MQYIKVALSVDVDSLLTYSCVALQLLYGAVDLLGQRTMSEYTIEITPQSKVVIFQGSLKKAPPLNKRGRKVIHCHRVNV